MDSPKVLIVDDDPSILKVLAVNLSDDFKVVACKSGDQALDTLEQDTEITVVLTDLTMRKMNGEELFRKVNSQFPHIPVVFLTGHGNVESAVKLVKEGAFDYLQKPADDTQLIKVLKAAVKQNSLQQEIHFLRQEINGQKMFCNIIGKSGKMLAVFDLIKSVAATSFNVLIEGETGTGKELVARAIHLKSHRNDKPFIAINCSAIPPALMESELFGHEPGSFTGALKLRQGKLEAANNGSLFLDEIGELNTELQAKFLRVLEDGIFQRVGSNLDIKPDFRLIAATNRDLKEEVKKKHFREDLFYRLNTITIKLPPLRERGLDILYLAEFFLKKYSSIVGKEVTGIVPDALNILYEYDWPGNIRELENIVKRALTICKGSKIKKSDLPPDLVEATYQKTRDKNKLLSKEQEKQNIIAALKKTKGNKVRTASLLKIERTQLYRKIKRYNINCSKI